jgi:conserved oligomeric Golgi complex subunit 1
MSIDTQLQTLQVLSAHVKLLLDTPEHLWHLIEHKKYFEAAWLFLFARLVHRNLMRDEAQDGESWSDQGIDIEVCHWQRWIYCSY